MDANGQSFLKGRHVVVTFGEVGTCSLIFVRGLLLRFWQDGFDRSNHDGALPKPVTANFHSGLSVCLLAHHWIFGAIHVTPRFQ